MALSDINQEVSDKVSDLFKTYGDTIVTALQQSLTTNKKVASGKLFRSIDFRIDDGKKVITLEILGDQILKYGGGRAPGKKPPFEEILKWIRVKGIEANGIISKEVMRKGKSVIRRKNVRDSQEQFAYAIQKSIMRRGTTSTDILEPVIEQAATGINKELGDILTEIIKGSITDVFDAEGNVLNLTYTIS